MEALAEVAGLIALACGAGFLRTILEACLRLTGQPLHGLAVFFFLLVGLPILTVAWGFVSGRLPFNP